MTQVTPADVFVGLMSGTSVDGISAAAVRFDDAPRGRVSADLSADFVFQSKGRVTERGYEVEVRIPFKSIRYQAARVQRWSLQVRQVKTKSSIPSW